MHIDSLVHELQLKSKLNQSLQQSHRADFNLMLALLSHDANEFAEFSLPKEDINQSGIDEAGLKIQLGVHPEIRLEADKAYYDIADNFSQQLSAGLQSNKLSLYMFLDTLSQYDDAKKIDETVLANCSVHKVRQMSLTETKAVESDITKMLDIVTDAKAYLA